MTIIAVYTVAKNEEAFVTRWAESCAEADYRIILDTGSTDRTVRIAQEAGVNATVQIFDPWRFDVARNAALSLVPEDVDMCISLDMDEVLMPGWRSHVEQAHEEGITRPRYQYTWSWNAEGAPDLQYGGDKIHARRGYYWKHPVHEVLIAEGQERQSWIGLEIHHYPDREKSRSHYLPLLELAVREDPEDDRNSHYLAREYMYRERFEEAAREFKRHLALPRAQWRHERGQSLRFLAKCEPEEAESWLLRAAAESPNRREPWVDLAELYYQRQDWPSCYSAAKRALSLERKPLEYMTEGSSWGAKPDDLAAVAAFRLGMMAQAVEHGRKAVALEPSDERLRSNLTFYLGDA